MSPHLPFPRPIRTLLVALTAATLSACGGGGDSAGTTDLPTVSSASVGAARYSQQVLVTINGTHLDGGLTVASAGCKDMARSTAAPHISSAGTAYYTCTASAPGAQNVAIVRSIDNVNLFTAPFTVPVPQVTMAVDNGAGISGSLVITLAPDKAPITVDNFLAYVNSGFYDGTIFHRVEPGFVIQGGGYIPITTLPPTLKTGLSPPIALEVNKGLGNVQWSIAMARVGGNANSATSQFFINLVHNAFLDPHTPTSPSDDGFGYAAFGSVTPGTTAVVNAIVGAPCSAIAGFFSCVPTPNVVVISATQTQ